MYDVEPLPLDHPFRRMDNVVITPHLGYVSAQNYEIYFPESTLVTAHFGSPTAYKACTSFFAFHSTATSRMYGATLNYVLVPRCHYNGYSDIDYTTLSVSYATVAAVTNPSYVRPAWSYTVTSPESAWGGEIPDLCGGRSVTQDGYLVSSVYSNAAARADMRPCLPAPDGPMFLAWADPNAIGLAAGAVGMSSIHVYSTGPFASALNLTVSVFPRDAKVMTTASFVKNGDVLPLTITMSPNATSGAYYVVNLHLDANDYSTDSHLLIKVP